jgi:hypothetical protein
MGYNLWIRDLPDGEHISFKVGSYGSQCYLVGVFLAGYAVAGRPESGRVCAWLDPAVAVADGGPHPERNRPATVRALLAFNGDDEDEPITCCCPDDRVIERGVKLKPPTDPVLRDLVEFWRIATAPDLSDVEWDAAAAARTSAALDAVLDHVRPSCWWELADEAAAVFREAAERGLPVAGG